MATAPEGTEQAAGIPQLDFATFPNQIFWLVVTLVVLYLVTKRVIIPNVGGIMEKRKARMEDDLAQAEQKNAMAEELARETAAIIAEAEAEANRIAAGAREEIRAFNDQTMNEVAARIASRSKEAELRIAEIRASAPSSIAAISNEATAEIVNAILPHALDEIVIRQSVTARIGEEPA